LGNLEEGSSTGDFEMWLKGALWMDYLSLKRLHGGGLVGELLHWGPCVGNVVLRRKPQSTFCVECKALASLRHTHLGSFFLDPEDIRKLIIGAIWNCARGTRLL